MQTRTKCPAARQTESATHSTSCTDMVPVPSLTGARITLIVRRIGVSKLTVVTAVEYAKCPPNASLISGTAGTVTVEAVEWREHTSASSNTQAMRVRRVGHADPSQVPSRTPAAVSAVTELTVTAVEWERISQQQHAVSQQARCECAV